MIIFYKVVLILLFKCSPVLAISTPLRAMSGLMNIANIQAKNNL